MLAHTKTPHTDSIELRFIGPVSNREKAVKALLGLGFVDASESVTWEDVFPEYDESEMPGIILSGARGKEGLTQKQLSEATGIPQGHISAMENGKRQIGVKVAKKFGEALNINYRVFL